MNGGLLSYGWITLYKKVLKLAVMWGGIHVHAYANMNFCKSPNAVQIRNFVSPNEASEIVFIFYLSPQSSGSFPDFSY